MGANKASRARAQANADLLVANQANAKKGIGPPIVRQLALQCTSSYVRRSFSNLPHRSQKEQT